MIPPTLPVGFLRPWFLLGLLLVPLIPIMASRSGPLSLRQKLAAGIRMAMVLLLLLSLTGLRLIYSSDGVTVLVLVDRSSSILHESTRAALQSVEFLSRSLSPRDQLGIILFGREAVVERSPSVPFSAAGFTSAIDPGETDLAAAIRLAEGVFPPERSKRILLVSDGLETRGSALAEAEMARGIGVEIVALPVSRDQEEEVWIEGADLPRQVYPRQPFYLKLYLATTRSQKVRLQVERRTLERWSSKAKPEALRVKDLGDPAKGGADAGGSELPGAGRRAGTSGESSGGQRVDLLSQEVNLPAGKSLFLLSQTAGSGTMRYRITLEGERDRWAANNQVQGTVQVVTPPAVLYLEGEVEDPDRGGTGAESHGTGPRGTSFQKALQQSGIQIVRAQAGDFPSDLPGLLQYQGVILSDLPATQLSPRQLQMLLPYVRTLGGGLLMMGGPGSFGPGGYSGTPVEEVLPVRMAARVKKQMPAVSVILLVDKSGSMGEAEGGAQKIDMAREAAIALVTTLGTLDEVGVVAFDSASQWVVPLQQAKNKNAIIKAVATLRAGGGTDLYPALQEAEKAMNGASGVIRHLIILSDGQTPPRDFQSLIRKMTAKKITLSTVALGRDADLPFLARLAALGDGRTYAAQEAALLPQIFTSEFFVASRRMIREMTFRPELKEDHASVAGLPWKEAPPLRGYVVTEAREEATVPLEAPDGDPLLALWHAGSGRAAAFTSDAKGRWGKEFVKWKGYSGFWEQVIHWLVGDQSPSPYWLSGRVEKGEAVVHLEVTGHAPSPRMSLLSPSLIESELSPQMNPDGSYTMKIPLQSEGIFTLTALPPLSDVSAPGSPGLSSASVRVAPAILSLSAPYSQEFLPSPPNLSLLYQITARTGGVVIKSPQEIPAGPTRKRGRGLREIGDLFLPLALLLFLFDVAIRKLVIPWQQWLKLIPASRAAAAEAGLEAPPVMALLFQAKARALRSSPPAVQTSPVKDLQAPAALTPARPESEATPPPAPSRQESERLASTEQAEGSRATLKRLKASVEKLRGQGRGRSEKLDEKEKEE